MSYDVVVIGGGAAGCATAYNLGLNNKKVLLIEKNILKATYIRDW